jgi:hypothetical protein
MKISQLLPLLLIPLAISCSKTTQTSLPKNLGLQEGTRQIHLDFHTSEAIERVGFAFDKKQFQEALIAGNVNSINIFGKGHHSWCYYPSEVGNMHPGLEFDLLGAQIEACHEIDVTAQVYFTIGWSANDAINHPEWAILNKDGTNDYREMVKDLGPEDPFGWGWELLSPEGEYLDLILAQTEEIVKNYEVDGMWFDIVPLHHLNYSESSKQDMLENGIDINDPKAVEARHVEKMNHFLSSANELVKRYRPEASIYYNWTTHASTEEAVETLKYKFYQYNTKHDLEDLPTAWGGYDIFPWRSKYFANTGKEIVAMSGKFHKSWGEFGGFKHKDAILYEAASMVAFGASANFGDQLHPSGKMEMATYENIGYAYDYVELIEAYGVGADHIASTGVYVSPDKEALEGTVQMLLECQVNFNVVNTLEDWSDIETLIITSGGVSESDIPKITTFIEEGGKVLAMGEGIFVNGSPIIDIGADYMGSANYDVDYTMVEESIGEEMVFTPFLNYTPALRVNPHEGTEILAHIREPYFSRTIAHYCSHKNTPYTMEDAAHPAAIKSGNVVYLAHDLDRQYYAEGVRLHRTLFENALRLLRKHPMVTAEMPSSGRINLLHQPDKKRYVAHLLYASPIQRGSVRVIEDIVPLYNIPVAVKLPHKIKKAYLIPSGESLTLHWNGNVETMVVPELNCHTALVFEY